MANVKIADIIVGNRFRKQLGDIKSLSENIDMNGLISPLVVTDKNELIAGERRLEALKLLGFESAPCHIVGVDENGALNIEYSENEERKDFTETERFAIYEAMKDRLGIAKGGQVGNQNKSQETKIAKVAIFVLDSPAKIKYKKRDILAKAGGLDGDYEATELSRIVKAGTQELKDDLDSGDISRHIAYKIAALDKETQTKAITAFKECGDYQAYALPKSGIEAMKAKELSKKDIYSICKRFKKKPKRALDKAVKDKKTLKIEMKISKDTKKDDGYVTIEISKKHPFEAVSKLFDVLGYDDINKLIDHIKSKKKKIQKENK